LDDVQHLIAPMLLGFDWFDEGLQRSLVENGWPRLSRPESIVMMHVQMGVVRPADIARSLNLTRQAVHVTVRSLIGRGLFELRDDPRDKRMKVVSLTLLGTRMQADAQAIVEALTEELAERIGGRQIKALRDAFRQDWGAPVVHRIERAP
jgi:DNA-binding MarR family transcriptional regulator